jgi:Aspartyl/Asparaginyl beta-hydroxylase
MFIDGDIKIIGDVDHLLIQAVLKTIDDINWYDKKFNRYEPSLLEGRLCTLPYPIRNQNQQTYTDDQKKLIEAVMPIVNQVSNFFSELVTVRGEIVNLLPGKELTLHKDIYWFHKYSRRIHIPLCTNSECRQIFEDREYHLKVGKFYEINNRILHSAYNRGSVDRIHIILDLMSKEKSKEALDQPGLVLRIENET